VCYVKLAVNLIAVKNLLTLQRRLITLAKLTRLPRLTNSSLIPRRSPVPDKMLLIDSSEYQSKEMARLCNIPSYLAGIAVGGYSYVSNQGEARLVVVWCETIRGLHRVNTLTKQRPTKRHICRIRCRGLFDSRIFFTKSGHATNA
jgi:hypothetical protein